MNWFPVSGKHHHFSSSFLSPLSLRSKWNEKANSSNNNMTYARAILLFFVINPLRTMCESKNVTRDNRTVTISTNVDSLLFALYIQRCLSIARKNTHKHNIAIATWRVSSNAVNVLSNRAHMPNSRSLPLFPLLFLILSLSLSFSFALFLFLSLSLWFSLSLTVSRHRTYTIDWEQSAESPHKLMRNQ